MGIKKNKGKLTHHTQGEEGKVNNDHQTLHVCNNNNHTYNNPSHLNYLQLYNT